MKLKKLLSTISVSQVRGSRDVEITGVCSDSRLIAPGNLFVARKGLEYDGAHYIPAALAAGAAAIATDLADPTLKVTQLVSSNLSALEADLAATFYGHPSRDLFTVGITGTNGKTSTCFLVKHLLEPCGLVSTVATMVADDYHPATHTTPDVCSLHRLLRDMVRHDCEAVALEVSSHALDQQRVQHVEFDVGVFTNLSHDHLDYHDTIEAYAAAKARLFDQVTHAVVNGDHPWHKQMVARFKGPITTYGFGDGVDLQALRCNSTLQGTTFDLGETTFEIPLIGRFNVLNALAAIAVGRIGGLTDPFMQERLLSLPQVRGRLERVADIGDRHVFVDYAHTPDALNQALSSLREVHHGRLIVVFGCGGDRDPTKRPEMGRVACELADIAIVTSDNPRMEDPAAICREVAGSANPTAIIVDRAEAISHALKLATADDLVLIAGKGHETYQVVGRSRLPFDDREIVRRWHQEESPCAASS